MSRYNLFFPLIILMSSVIFSSISARAEEADGESIASSNGLSLVTVSLSYVSWTEFVDLDDGVLADRAFANFYGNALGIEREVFNGRKGYAIEATLMTGQANAGGSQTIITYQTSYQKWWGAMASARYAYRLSPQITMSVGPLALNRQLTWPDEGTGVSVKSGSQLNYGLLADLRLRLDKEWELRQTIGTLAFKASTIWSLGVGYKF